MSKIKRCSSTKNECDVLFEDVTHLYKKLISKSMQALNIKQKALLSKLRTDLDVINEHVLSFLELDPMIPNQELSLLRIDEDLESGLKSDFNSERIGWWLFFQQHINNIRRFRENQSNTQTNFTKQYDTATRFIIHLICIQRQLDCITNYLDKDHAEIFLPATSIIEKKGDLQDQEIKEMVISYLHITQIALNNEVTKLARSKLINNVEPHRALNSLSQVDYNLQLISNPDLTKANLPFGLSSYLPSSMSSYISSLSASNYISNIWHQYKLLDQIVEDNKREVNDLAFHISKRYRANLQNPMEANTEIDDLGHLSFEYLNRLAKVGESNWQIRTQVYKIY